MAAKKEKSAESSSVFSSLISGLADMLGSVGLFFFEVKRTIQGQLDWLLRRMEYIFIVYLWVSAGMIFLILGVFYLAIDLGHLPRGVVFTGGGLLILLVSVIFLQAAKIKRK